MNTILQQSKWVYDGWNSFWFDSKSNETLTRLAAFRIVFSSIMLFYFSSRTAFLEFFYSEKGILPYWHLANISYLKYRPSLIHDLSLLQIQTLHFFFLFSLFMLAIGAFTRVFAVIVLFLHVNFINRNIGATFGIDTIASFFIFYLCFVRSNARFSVDALIKLAPKSQNLISHIAWRFMQLQLCIVYAYSGLEKLKGTHWWDGSAIWDVLSIGNMQRWDLSFVSHIPFLLAVNVYLVLFWEIYFPVLIWAPKLRRVMLTFGVMMHLGIFIFLNLPSFAFMMMSLYILFLTKDEIEKFLEKIPFMPKHN